MAEVQVVPLPVTVVEAVVKVAVPVVYAVHAGAGGPAQTDVPAVGVVRLNGNCG